MHVSSPLVSREGPQVPCALLSTIDSATKDRPPTTSLAPINAPPDGPLALDKQIGKFISGAVFPRNSSAVMD